MVGMAVLLRGMDATGTADRLRVAIHTFRRVDRLYPSVVEGCEIAGFRSPRRARPICWTNHTDFTMRSRLIAGVIGHFLTYPARYSSEAVSTPSRTQTR